ncbi:MAG: isocitrate/isopropylmalate dehydrogenase family protein [Rhodospirillales bacterium]|jgi:3-isopropylmalate dehydrogenase|nr:isocitrate/isopropylmalate dehydrogenase family protein [Rhodospirillales bacterium]
MRILVLPGDGIGPEITAACTRVLEALERAYGLGLVLEAEDIGFASLERSGTTITGDVVETARAADGVILGPVSHHAYPPREAGGLNPSAELRRRLDLYANIRPSRTRAGVRASVEAMDLVIVRENTEGFYADRNMYRGSGEFMPSADTALAVRKITREASQRIGRVAFELARRRRSRVTAVHKANVLHLSDGLFVEEQERLADEYADVAFGHMLVDAAASWLVRDPARFDVIVTTNMYGDILSNEAAELAGGLGLAESLNAGEAHGVAQAAHGSAPDIAGRDVANPSALLLSVAMLLDWLGDRHGRDDLRTAAASVRNAIDDLLAAPATRTADLGGELGTVAFSDVLARRVAAGPQ